MRNKGTDDCVSNNGRVAAYAMPQSITGHLPWKEYSHENKCFLLSDGKSVGSCLEVTMAPVESRSADYLEALVKQIQWMIGDAVPQDVNDPWIVQCYVQDDERLDDVYGQLEKQLSESKTNPLKEAHLDIMSEHFDFLTQPCGAFYDRVVSGTRFKASERRVRLVIYRWYSNGNNESLSARVEKLRQIVGIFIRQLKAIGIRARVINGADFYDWLVRWFNPSPKMFDNDVNKLLAACPFPQDIPHGWDLSEQLFFSTPESVEDGWVFDDNYHQVVSIQSLRQSPKAGLLTAELPHLDNTYSLFDKLPAGSILNMTFVAICQRQVTRHLERVKKSAIGKESKAILTKSAVNQAEQAIEKQNYLFPTAINVYLKAETSAELKQQRNTLSALLNTNGLKTFSDANDLLPVQHYLTFLPMNYDYHFDKKNLYRSRYFYLSDIAKLLPLYGRSRGSSEVSAGFFNRGGEPIGHDPLTDWVNNAHMFIVGDTGTGKSNLLSSLMTSSLARHNPYLVILEAGGSFDLLAKFYEKHGKSVNKVDFTVPQSLNPFADAITALNQHEMIEQQEKQLIDSLNRPTSKFTIPENCEEESSESDVRDYFSEMSLALRLLVTGGIRKEEEKFTRTDAMLLMDILMQAAKDARDAGKQQVTITDILTGIETLITQQDSIQELDIIKRLREMHHNIRLSIRDTTARTFFNRPGEPWPINDVTLVNLSRFKGTKSEDNENDEKSLYLALAVIGCLNKVMALAESKRTDGRPIILAIDEAHILTKNPIIAGLLVLVAKMARKLGLWLWIATQHVRDLPNESKKILAMLETWICLVVGGQEQIDDIKRFKTLSIEDEQMLLNAAKQDGCYSEGVLLGKKHSFLFRNIPPREYLSLVMTNPQQKLYRQTLMEKHGIDEYAAAMRVAQEMKQQITTEDEVWE
tara:strand:+ start:8252 stop:11014 length:2763 start_codon:yes stop_codon:yes gene_type:complete